MFDSDVFADMSAEIENREPKGIPKEKYDLVVWTPHEKLFRARETIRNKILAKVTVPFTIALQVKLRRSLFGTYLEDFNENELQNEFINTNKLCITNTEIESFNPKERHFFDDENNIYDGIERCLSDAVTETPKIDYGYLYQKSVRLRLDDVNVNMVDDGLRNFKNLQVLVICGNWISDIHGCVLPRGLKFLELYVNEIKSVENLTYEAPKGLMHLGLGRNKLTNDSALHLFGDVGRFNSLSTLDLSECDIYSLVDALAGLQKLQELKGLCLQGNPCSMVTGYRNLVLHRLPNLLFLDGVEISSDDRRTTGDFTSGSDNAEMVLNCATLSNLPKPPKGDKKDKQTIHVEFVLPLFQEDLKSYDRTTKEKPGQMGATISKTSKAKSEKSPYAQPDEHDPKVINNCFKTDRKPWNNNMKFPPLLLKSPENNLLAYRDSFRSRVNVRVVYLKFRPPEKKKKGKTKKEKGGKKSKTSSTASEKPEKPEEEPQEKILKEVTLAAFHCDLTTAGWKKDVGFYWSQDPTFGNKAVDWQEYLEERRKEAEEKARIEAALKREKELQKKPQKGKKDKSQKSKSKTSKKSKSSKKEDKFMTCQVNFGLSRLGRTMQAEESSSKVTAKPKKKGRKSKS